ncbi:MAG: hypothetical protein R3A79_04395 [Nannocystaceae bacterium]
MKHSTLALSLALSLLAPLGCADAIDPDDAGTLRADESADLCADLELVRDGLSGVAAQPALASLAHDAVLAAAEAGADAVPMRDLAAAAQARDLDFAAAIEAGVRDRGGSSDDVARAQARLADLGIAPVLPDAAAGDAAPQWLVAVADDVDLSACAGPVGADLAMSHLAVEGPEASAAKNADEDPYEWDEFCCNMGLNLCYKQPFYYCCEPMN